MAYAVGVGFGVWVDCHALRVADAGGGAGHRGASQRRTASRLGVGGLCPVSLWLRAGRGVNCRRYGHGRGNTPSDPCRRGRQVDPAGGLGHAGLRRLVELARVIVAMGIKLTGGQWCGRVLAVPKGDKVRPTTGRVRESVLQKIAPYLAEARMLDGFAGSGLMGFECLSRGAATVTAVEQSPQHAKVITANAGLLGVTPMRYQLKVMPLQRYLAKPLPPDQPAYTVVYLDPPYAFNEWPHLLTLLKTHNHDQWPTVCLCEVAGDADPNTLLGEPWAKPLKARWRYGDTQVWWV